MYLMPPLQHPVATKHPPGPPHGAKPARAGGRRGLALSWALAAWLLGGCATGLRIDTSHTAQSQASRVQHIVLHYTVGRFDSALKTLTQGPVSSHYLVAQQPPTVYRLVDENRRAFHAGVSSWRGQTGINGSSIGIEIVNAGLLEGAPRAGEAGDLAPGRSETGRAETGRWEPGRWEPFPPEQVAVVIALVRDIAQRHEVKPHMIVGHSDVAPSRKMDPGPLFPWPQLHAAGLVPWPDAQQVAATQAAWASQPLPDAAWFQARLAQLGYALAITGSWDVATRDVLIAFQTRYRPRLFNGRPDVETAALLQVATTPGGLLMVQADGQRVAYRP